MTPAALRALLVVTVVAMSACSALRLTYGQGATLTYWWLDGYADFSRDQSPRVKALLGQWFTWHQRTQLADYTALLDRARQEVRQDTTPAQACAWWEVLMSRRDTALLALVPAVAEIGPTLSAEQREHVAGKLARNDEKWRDDHLQPDPAKRERAAVDRAVEQAEKLYGRLHRPQKELLTAQLQAAPISAEQTHQIRRAVQRDALRTLEQLAQPNQSSAQVTTIAQGWMRRLGHPPDATLLAQQQRLARHWCESAAVLHNGTDAAQREHAARTLQGWHDDLSSFITAAP